MLYITVFFMDQLIVYLEDKSYDYYSHEETILDNSFENVLLVWFTGIELVESLLTQKYITFDKTYVVVYLIEALIFNLIYSLGREQTHWRSMCSSL